MVARYQVTGSLLRRRVPSLALWSDVVIRELRGGGSNEYLTKFAGSGVFSVTL